MKLITPSGTDQNRGSRHTPYPDYRRLLAPALLSITEAQARVRTEGLPVLIVVDEDSRPLGVIAAREISRAARQGSNGSNLGSLLAGAPLVAGEGSSSEAIEMLLERAPVVPIVNHERRVTGVIASTDRRHSPGADDCDVCVLGLGYVGLTLAVVLADVGFRVTGVDRDRTLIDDIRIGRPHFHEKGLAELLSALDSRPATKPRYEYALEQCAEVYIISVGTPIQRPSLEPNLEYVRNAAAEVGRVLGPGNLVVLRSTVPVGVTRSVVIPILENLSGLIAGRDFSVAFCPERTVEGKALRELRELPQIIGGFDRNSADFATRLFSRNTPTIIDVGSLEGAEMVKIMDNTYRDVMFSYANQMALLCERLELDMVPLVQAANTGYNRNNIPMPSPGVGGACLSKDPYILASVCRGVGIDPTLFLQGRKINEYMPRHVVNRVREGLEQAGKQLAGATVFVLGFAFKGKPETSDLRDSPTLDLVKYLHEENASIRGFDPVVSPDEIAAIGVQPCELAAGFEGADAIIIMLNHPTFEEMDLAAMLPSANSPVVLVDGWHLFDIEELGASSKVIYGSIGR